MTEKLALTPYIEAVQQHCDAFAREELAAFVVRLAQEVPAAERAAFLRRLTEAGANEPGTATSVVEQDLAEKIVALRKEVEERINAIQSGNYYDDYTAWPEYFSAAQSDALTTFFRRAWDVFVAGHLDEAAKYYALLFDFPLEYARIQVDLREAGAAWARCRYETEPETERVPALLTVLGAGLPFKFEAMTLREDTLPCLQDVLHIRTGELPGWPAFLAEWEEALQTVAGERAMALRLEVMYLAHNMKKLEEAVHLYGAEFPRAYLYWLQQLESREDWQQIAQVAHEALHELPAGRVRALVAESLIRAAAALQDPDLALRGKRQRWLAHPDDEVFLAWLDEAEAQGRRDEELVFAQQNLSPSAYCDLCCKIYLISGQLDEAFDLEQKNQAKEWSHEPDNSTAMLFGALLAALLPAGTAPSPEILSMLENTANPRMLAHIRRGLEHAQIGGDHTAWLKWLEQTGRAEVEHIVGNQLRNAYHRAADILCALGEFFALRGEVEHARELIHHYREQRFSRHSAFLLELNQRLEASEILSKY